MSTNLRFGLALLVCGACASTPDLIFAPIGEAGISEGAADGSSALADAQGTTDAHADLSDASSSHDATSSLVDAGVTDAGSADEPDAAFVNTCPAGPPPGVTACFGKTACVERRSGDCASEMSTCTAPRSQGGCKDEVCCVDDQGNVHCASSPSACP